MTTAFAPGKLILLGEHAVVYGHRAVAAAVSLGTTVTLVAREGGSGLMAGAPSALWDDARLAGALARMIPPEGVAVAIDSTLPMGCGMGSSAALAVALVRALAAREGRSLAFEELHARAFVMERAFHGNPSGVDHAVSALGGTLLYRRGSDAPELEPLPLPSPLNLVVVDTGTPGDTAAMVAGVRQRREDDPAVAHAIDAIGAHVEASLDALRAGDLAALGRAFSVNHAWLQRLGVSTPRLDVACALLESSGALGAKLAGAGGGGVCFGLVPSAPAGEGIARTLNGMGFRAFPVLVGAAASR